MLEITVCFAAQRTEETRNKSDAFRISLIVNLAIIMLLIQLLTLGTLLLVCDMMLAVTIITITGTGEVAVLDSRSRH
jgi:heme/copper-type cytochrome/quinol oxidase subunit 1